MTIWIQNPFDNLPCEGFRKQRYWLMCEAFAAAGHRVVFWTSDFSHANKAKRKLRDACDGARAADEGIALRLVPTLPYPKNVCWARVRSHRAYAREWIRLARAETEKPDVIVSSMPTLSTADAALVLGRETGAKVVVDVMDAWPETFERLAPRGLRGLARLLLAPLRRKARRIYRDADLVTGVCERYRGLVGRPDYWLAYHGVELEPGERAGEGASGRADGGAVRLVYAGCLGRTYDLDTVLHAVAENPDFSLDVAGKWDRPVPERVTAHGYLGREDLRRLLASCDVGVIPMNAESWVGVPYKLCDYAAAGLRIVSSLGGETSDLLRRYGCGETYRAGNAASLAAAVRRAASDRSSREMCEREFDARKIYAAYVTRVLEELDGTRSCDGMRDKLNSKKGD